MEDRKKYKSESKREIKKKTERIEQKKGLQRLRKAEKEDIKPGRKRQEN